jgi:uncharacterized phage-associated protein
MRGDNMNKVLNVAEYFLSLSKPNSRRSITHLKLQKLVYYAQGFSLALYGETLFKERLEAWIHGPVSPSVYRNYSHFNYNEIPSEKEESDFLEILSGKEKELIKLVWKYFGEFTGKELENKTHEETPWLEARGDLPSYVSSNQEIKISTMKQFFKKTYLGDND